MENLEPRINSNYEKKENIFDEEELLKKASIFCQENRLPESDIVNAEKITEEIEKLPIYHSYKNREFTLEKLEQELTRIEEEENSKDAAFVIDFLKDEANKIREANHRYNQLVRGFENSMKIENFRMDEERRKEKIEKYDRARKDCHNSIVSSFNAINRHIKETLPEKFNIQTEQDFLLSKKEEMDEKDYRNYVGHWSRVTATGEELDAYKSQLIEHFKKASA